MLPRFEVDPVVSEIDPGSLRVIWIDDAMTDGIGDNRNYQDLDGVTWQELHDLIAAESGMVGAAADRAVDSVDFDRIIDDEFASQCEAEDVDGELLSDYATFDVGVISAAAALAAAGCITTTSCRGHETRGEPNPLVRFTTDEKRLQEVRSAASSANCGLLLDSEGMLQLYATNVMSMIAFAQEMLARRRQFDVITTQVAVQRPDRYVGDLLADVRRRDL
jgi:hypothetical protein